MKFCFSTILLLVLASSCQAKKKQGASVLVLVRGQSDMYSHQAAYDKQQKLNKQIEKHNLRAEVALVQQEWPVEAAWTLFPLIPDMHARYGDKYEWVLVIESYTQVNLKKLATEVLPQHDSDDLVLLGRCLHDDSPTIIHHFAFFDGEVKKFNYPDMDAGVLFSTGLLAQIADEYSMETQKANFQIDIKHEIAKILHDKYDVKMTCQPQMCGVKGSKDDCVTWLDSKLTSSCGGMWDPLKVQFSVKTTEKFHKDRIPVVKATWGRFMQRVTYYSNVTDEKLGMTNSGGVPNTEQGHCGKMEKIIRDFNEMDGDWLVIVDDDTIFSVARMLQMLSCYNHQHNIVIGERYGFGLNTGYGYSYITGGGGMVMSRKAVTNFVEKGCKCPHISTPDDMYLGQCFSRTVGIPVTHSPLFHQARPEDYSTGFLGNQDPISFHKHWQTDPVKVYREWFLQADKEAFPDVEFEDLTVKTEL